MKTRKTRKGVRIERRRVQKFSNLIREIREMRVREK